MSDNNNNSSRNKSTKDSKISNLDMMFPPIRGARKIGNALALPGLMALSTVNPHVSPMSVAVVKMPPGTARDLGQIKIGLRILVAVGDMPVLGGWLKGPAGIALEIVDIIETVQSNKDEFYQVAHRVYGLLHAVQENGIKSEVTKLQESIQAFERDLGTILASVQSLSSKGTFRHVIQGKSIKDKFADIDILLNHYTNIFVIRTQVQMANTVQKIHASIQRIEPHFANQPAPQAMISSKVPAILPPKPRYFVGRDQLLTNGTNHLLTTPGAWVAILGAGGMGKTTLALAILYHEKIKQAFENKCYFVSCEALKTDLDLVNKIITTLGASQIENSDIMFS